MPANYDSASVNSFISIEPSKTFTSSSVSMEKSNNQPTMSTITTSVKTNSFNSSQSTASVVQASPNNFNPLFTSSNVPVMNSLVTSHIESLFVQNISTAVIESSFNSETSISSTSPENFHYTSSQICPQSTVMPAPSISSPNTFSTNRWRCIEGNVTGDNTREYIFPALVMADLNLTLWQDTLQGVSYSYHLNSSEIGCSGTVTEIRFCYRVSLNVHTEEHIFTMSIMNNSRHVLKTVEITSTPTNSSGDSTTINCINVYNKKYCCDSMTLTDDKAIIFPTSEFILGIETSNSSQVRLQNFKRNVSQKVYNIPILNSFPERNTTGTIATTLPVIRFKIRKFHCALV